MKIVVTYQLTIQMSITFSKLIFLAKTNNNCLRILGTGDYLGGVEP